MCENIQRNGKYMYASFFKGEARMKIATLRLQLHSLREKREAKRGTQMKMRPEARTEIAVRRLQVHTFY